VASQGVLAGFGLAAELFSWSDNRFHSIEEQARELFAAAVIACEEQTFSEVGKLGEDRQAKCPALAMPRLFGGFAFQDDFTPDNTWAVFHPAHFILPHYQLALRDDESWLTINALIPHDEDPQMILPELRAALEARLQQLLSTPAVRRLGRGDAQWHIRYPTDYKQWEEMINAAIAQMQHGHLKKVVLARVCEIRQSSDIDVDGAFAYLGRRYDDCFLFLFEPQPGHAFLGATPELLTNVHGDEVATMALAGSIRRGDTAAEDDRLAQELLSSAKDRYEHALVVQAIESRLTSLTNARDVPAEPTVYRLKNIQHLYTPIRARLRPEYINGVLPLLGRLHPTPAMGGSPRDLALEAIHAAEPVPRGWYAAPIGWIDHRLDGAFAVAIRSAVCQQRRAWLYAGAGIVADSIAEREWEETALKFRPMLEAITGRD
jgi:menaquinone-specific isochorismate synthase